MKEESKGSLLGSILLISGSCIGAGMLGLPMISALSGFIPSILMFIFSWVFMTFTGLLLLEVALNFDYDVNLITMAGKTLGNLGKFISWVSFVFLFYALMVAYTSGSGKIFSEFAHSFFGFTLKESLGSALFVLFFGLTVYIGTYAVDLLNRFLMFGLILSYFLLVAFGLSYVDSGNLFFKEWKVSFFALPVMVISFGYHNLIPSIATYLKRNTKKLVAAVVIGSFIPFLVYLLWEWLVLGIIPLEIFQKGSQRGEMVTSMLHDIIGSNVFVSVAESFAFFAIVTSFIGVALSFVDFLSDGLPLKKTWLNRLAVCLLALGPPFLFSIIYPNLFLAALEYAGGFGAVILFGVLPVLMVYSGRKSKEWRNIIVPGGNFVLSIVLLFSIFIFLIQLYQAVYKDVGA